MLINVMLIKKKHVRLSNQLKISFLKYDYIEKVNLNKPLVCGCSDSSPTPPHFLKRSDTANQLEQYLVKIPLTSGYLPYFCSILFRAEEGTVCFLYWKRSQQTATSASILLGLKLHVKKLINASYCNRAKYVIWYALA